MAETVKQTIARTSGGGSAPTRYTKSARTSARAFAQSGVLGRNVQRRKSLGGKGG
ncbi:MAG: hypothetical protein NC253_15650 [Ruminococcus sp.]|nr:hypothetical protein [Ruminococcus sp.]MCM1380585.1 hypothetical protein [Muribaculaceae bacterium]MCM1479768.1 hypothetical protein [Muribaculaceae bacterium]